MKLIRNFVLAVIAFMLPLTPAFAQVLNTGSSVSIVPNFRGAAQTFTATGTGTTLALSGYNSGIVQATANTGGIGSFTYISGGTVTGSSSQTCTVTLSGGATGTVALTGTNAIATSTAGTVVTAGTGYTAPVYTATLSNGTATCTGTVTILSTLATYFGGIGSFTYTSGGTISGTTGQTCTVTFSNGGTGTLALTGSNTIAGSTAGVVTAAGTGATTAPTSATLGSGTATCSGTATVASVLTQLTFAVQGSIDGGSTWFSLPLAAYPTTSVPITTTALTETATANSQYAVNLVGVTNYRYVVSSTFTLPSAVLKLTATANKGYL